MKKRNSKFNGFSLIEMMVVMSIIAILAVLVLANYQASQKRYALAQAVQRLVSDLRKTQNMAISGSGIYSGYGIYANSNSTSYVIFGNNGGTPRFDDGDVALETINLPPKIKILSVSPLRGGLDITFKPPAPTTYINGQSTLGSSAVFTLQTEDGSLTKTATVTTAGLINSN